MTFRFKRFHGLTLLCFFGFFSFLNGFFGFCVSVVVLTSESSRFVSELKNTKIKCFISQLFNTKRKWN